jgi:hypothetical protein
MITTEHWVVDREPSRRFPVYTRGNSGEVFPNVMTPMTGSLIATRRPHLWFRGRRRLSDGTVRRTGWRRTWNRDHPGGRPRYDRLGVTDEFGAGFGSSLAEHGAGGPDEWELASETWARFATRAWQDGVSRSNANA